MHTQLQMLREPLPPSPEPRLRSASLRTESRGGLQSIQDEDCCDPTWGDNQIKLKMYNCLFRCQIVVTKDAHDCCGMNGSRRKSSWLWLTLETWQALGRPVTFAAPSLKRVYISANGDAKRVYYLSGNIYIKWQWFISTRQVLCAVHLGCRAECEPGKALGDPWGWTFD